MRSSLVLLIVVTGCAASTPRPAYRSAMYTVRGTIVDSATHEPFFGATVLVITSPPAPPGDNRFSAITDEHGVYQVDLVARPVRVDIYYDDTVLTRSVEHTANGRDYVVATVELDVPATSAADESASTAGPPDPRYLCLFAPDYTATIPVPRPVHDVVCLPSLGGLRTTCADLGP